MCDAAAARSGIGPATTRFGIRVAAAERAGGGLAADAVGYLAFTVFAALTAGASTLSAHRAWGGLAASAYATATLVALAQLILRRLGVRAAGGTTARLVVTGLAWSASAIGPLLVLAAARVSGQLGRAQEEVLVIEDGGQRLLSTGSPYLSRDAIAALPEPDQLLGYLPYQPGMALFGLPRAVDAQPQWWSDARVWFAAVTTGALVTALVLLWRGGPDGNGHRLVRAAQVATVLPLAALTLATGGDDLPVLALCLLGFALAARGRPGWSGLAVGAAAGLKLFAWPIALVLAAYFAARSAGALLRYLAGAAGLPAWFLIIPLARDASAVLENVVRFPFGDGLVTSPAQSPLPGYLVAHALPHGRALALLLLVTVAVAIGVGLVRRPPETPARAARISGYGLLAAMMLMPSTRFGYLLYPAALLVWAWALAETTPSRKVRQHQCGSPSGLACAAPVSARTQEP